MQTLKTAVVVVLLLFVLYGGYVALNGTDTPMSEELQNLVSVGETSADVSTPPPFEPSAPAPRASGEDPFKKFASLPAPSFTPPSKPGDNSESGIPPLPAPSLPTAPNIPEIPEMDLPELAPPSSLPTAGGDQASAPSDRKINAQEASAKVDPSKNEPGFGLALPSAKANDVALLPKTSPSSLPNVPALDLPTIHGEAQTLADATSPKSNTATRSTEPSIPASKPARSFENAKQLAMDQIKDGDLKKALATLSLFYNASELTSSQRDDLVDLLDALSREVVFSRRHLMDFAFTVAAGDTWDQIAKQYDVPADILARINGLDPSQDPPSGFNLKVVPGPFRAEVDLAHNEITLFVGDLYACRYPCSFGQEPRPELGVFQVQQKSLNRNYYSSNGASIHADDPTNPYGGIWIDLGQSLCIHSSPKEDRSSPMGCISLSPLDASDVFGMLGVGSQVTIRR